MIYLIGGPPRVGKTTIANKVLREKMISFISTDVIFGTIMDGAPQLGITDMIPTLDRAKSFIPFFKEFVHHLVEDLSIDYLVEGEIILPEQVDLLSKKYSIKAAFLGFSEITLEKLLETGGESQWIRDLAEEEQQKFPKRIVEFSNYLKEDCKKYNLMYFDLSKNYDEQLEKAYEYLLSDPAN